MSPCLSGIFIITPKPAKRQIFFHASAFAGYTVPAGMRQRLKKPAIRVMLFPMISDIELAVRPGEDRNPDILRQTAADALGIPVTQVDQVLVRKKSVDARRKRVRIILRCTVCTGGSRYDAEEIVPPGWKKADPDKRVVIAGAGPAGLFAALRLLEEGITPVIAERGPAIETRKQDIAAMLTSGRISPHSNYCFGEGGAGAFSDGKLYTRANKRGDVRKIAGIFCLHGGSPSLLTDAHPHIGTDRLPGILSAIRKTILSFGGEIRFDTACTGLLMQDGRVCGVRTESGAIPGQAVIFACGHSAPDTIRMLAESAGGKEYAPRVFCAKTFAMGVRVEHPRALIDAVQYRGAKEKLPAAEYRLSAQCGERGVYTFCMCPGGTIVPASSSPDEIVVNGMSDSARDGPWSNAAVVVEIRPQDIGADGDPEKAFLYQLRLGQEAKMHGDGLAAPAQRLTDFLDGKRSSTLPDSSYRPGLRSSRLDLWLPEHIAVRLREGLHIFGRRMKGFVTGEALLVASETRTSSAIRILRDPGTMQSPVFPGLYPAGEGAGYAGGIVSSAMDGERCAEAAAKTFTSP